MNSAGDNRSFRYVSIIQVAVLLLCVTSTVQAGGKLEVGWDKNTDFSKYRTYAWGDHPPTTRPFVGIEIKANADEQLKMKGLTVDNDHPDLIVNFYGQVDSMDSVPASDPTYAAVGGTPLQGTTMWTNNSVGTVVSVSKGSLVIDMRDASTKHSVWRAIAKGTLKEKSSELQKQVQTSIAKMFQGFPPSKSAK